MITEFAPAKINLALHLTGQRDDGYHLLDSLVVFADIGDRLDIAPANTLSLTIEGPRAEGVPTDLSNSILKAAQLFQPQETGAAFLLTKTLPSAAGIGGGSADAAAALRGLSRLWGDKTPEQLFPKGLDPDQLSEAERNQLTDKIKSLGADVPVCLFSRTARMRGIGEALTFITSLPRLHAVLVNPGVAVSTPDVFKAITRKDNPGLPDTRQDFASAESYIDWLRAQRNDMQTAACQIAPEISDALAALDRTAGCQLARMSGSGATCFGLFLKAQSAAQAAHTISTAQPAWWVKPCKLG
ncbi:MAG: 4-(cytidine 5'-diphospho)-2-C-methyl-D-erythritol kinase [Pseudomonadota bacterium]